MFYSESGEGRNFLHKFSCVWGLKKLCREETWIYSQHEDWHSGSSPQEFQINSKINDEATEIKIRINDSCFLMAKGH
jgi:hypothetical protein